MRLIKGLIVLTAAAVILSGCTATEQGAGIGAATGAGLGAIIGHQSGQAGEGAAIGAAAGAITGGLIGHQADKKQHRQEVNRAYQEGRRDAPKGPEASAGSKGTWVEGHYEYVTKKEWVDTTTRERVWVEEQVIGDRRIEGHWEERDVPSGHWRSYEEKTWVPGHYE
jgi:hypothetical protein